MFPQRTLSCVLAASLLAAPVAHAYELIGPRWPVSDFPIPWKLDADGSRDISTDADKTAVQNAFNAWNQVGGTRASVAAFTDLASNQLSAGDDNTNKVYWVENNTWRYGQFTLGVTTPLYYTTGEIFDADIVFNGRDYTWRTGSGNYCSNCTDVFSIAIHEQGHFYGLDHSCSPNSSGTSDDCGSGTNGSTKRNAVMFAAYPGSPKQALNPDDIAGIRALYPAPAAGSGVQGSGCIDNAECGANLACSTSGGVKICAAACAGTGQSTCATGYTCQNGRCLYSANEVGDLCKPCSATSDCGNGVCIGTEDFAICSRPCGTGANQGCPSGYGCFVENENDTTGFCFPESQSCAGNCSAQNPCPTGQTCQSGSCRWSVANEGEHCPSGACAANLVCVGTDSDGYRCRRNCSTTANCAAGQQCLPLSGGGGACFPGGNAGPGDDCESPADCRSGLLCVAESQGAATGTCFTECTPGGANTCAVNEACEAIGGGQGICYPEDVPPERVGMCEACGNGVLCETGLLCISATGGSTCQRRCTSDTQCGANRRCATVGSNRFCTCNTGDLKGDGESCAADAECLSGFECIVDGVASGPVCREACDSAADCDDDQACSTAAGDTYCLPASDSPDGGSTVTADGGTGPKPQVPGCPGCASGDPAGLAFLLLVLARRRARVA